MELTTHKPERADLWFRQLMMSDEETMFYNHAWGGTIPFPEEKWDGWYDRWIVHPEGKRYYRYLKEEDGRFIGEIAYHFDDGVGGYMANVIVYAKYRGMGYGKQALEILCTAAKGNGISVLYDDIAIDNPAIALFLKQGFTEMYRTEEIIMLRKDLQRQ